MAGGVHFSMFVDHKENVWVCGANQKGELGLGHTTQINSPQKNRNVINLTLIIAT
jgi:alpha-tubulin suppressor-like RCC1 family protein